MESVRTNPQVTEAIISELHKWRSPGYDLVRPPMMVILAHMQQGDIGWNLALEG